MLSIWMRVAGAVSLASSAIAAVAVVLLTLMFIAFGLGAMSPGSTIGWVNDVLTLVAYLLALPGVLATAVLLRSRQPGLILVGALIAVASIGVICALQWQLVTGAMTFEQQIGPVTVAFLTLGAWFVLSAHVGADRLGYGIGIGLLAALYVGYPVLAYRLGRSMSGTIR